MYEGLNASGGLPLDVHQIRLDTLRSKYPPPPIPAKDMKFWLFDEIFVCKAQPSIQYLLLSVGRSQNAYFERQTEKLRGTQLVS